MERTFLEQQSTEQYAKILQSLENCVNHPFLVQEPKLPALKQDMLVTASAKLTALEILLPHLVRFVELTFLKLPHLNFALPMHLADASSCSRNFQADQNRKVGILSYSSILLDLIEAWLLKASREYFRS